MHDEVFEATQDTSSVRETPTGASSPSEAYANLTLEGEPTSDADRSRAADSKPRPRAASPAKRLHSDMDGAGGMDVDAPASARRGSGQSSPLAARPPPTAAQRSLRATSVDMMDAVSNGGSATGSDSTNASTEDSAATSISVTPAADIPSLDEQVNLVITLTRAPYKDRQVGYIVAQKWLERVWARTPQYAGKQHEFSKSATEGEIGPVNNSSLVDAGTLSNDLVDQQGEEFIPLRRGLAMEQDFEVLPSEAWKLIVSWYGIKQGSPVIRRYVHNTSPNAFSENLQYELWPPIFTLRRVRRTAPSNQEPSKKLVASTSNQFVGFVKAAKKSVGIDNANKVRIWRVLNTTATAEQARQVPSGMITPEASPPPPAIPFLIIDAPSLLRLQIGTEREEVTGKDESANEVSNHELTLGAAGLAEDQILILEEHDESGEYITGATSKSATKSGLLGIGNVNKGIRSTPNSGRSTPNPTGPMTRGRTRSGRTRGTVGLTNLGNTCYMNSALQCIRSVEELAIFFLHGQYKQEINSSNPLGHGGAIAKAYSGLMNSIYSEDATTAFAPKNFKYALGRAQPLFSGYGQQDSQEFLSFLVDGLHEDLNRIIKKPYTEYPESDDKTVHDPEAIKALGDKFRAIHHSRNDSVAMDLFNGFYKNTMVCPDCARVSITFDPYSLLTLQLPIEQTWQHTARFVPLRGKIWDVDIDIDKHATIRALKDYVGSRFGVTGDRIMASEVYSHKFYRHLDDSDTIAESNIGQKDYIYFYELQDMPSNWPPPKKKKKTYHYMSHDSEDDLPDVSGKTHDRIIIPIFHRIPAHTSTTFRPQWSLTLSPSYILIDREEAKDYDSILKKVLLKIEQMTSRPIFTESQNVASGQSRAESDVVLTTEEDASLNGDSEVQDGSVEGEDSMVEVTMNDPPEHGTTPVLDDDDLPAMLHPGGFLPPEFRNLFEMKHTSGGRDYVMTGWSSIDTNKSFESISKRVRLPVTRESSVQSQAASSTVTSSDEDDDMQFSASANEAIQIAEQSSDEDAQPSIEPMNAARAGRRKPKHRKQKKQYGKNKDRPPNYYAKRNKDRFLEQPSQSYADSESEDDDRLIRLGEGIVLDWNVDAFDALFKGSSADDPRGMDTSKFVETFDDPELKSKKAKRAARRKHGITLEECFAETSKSEVLSQDNAWYCSRCKELRRATKTLEIWTAPDILVVHLKRFASHRTFRDKVDALVDFPVEGLDLAGKVGLPEDKELVYDLFAVDNHYGGLGGGHYTAFAKNFFDQQWYEYNDSSVQKRGNPDSVVTQAAYLLFYRRRSAGPLGPPALQDIVNAWRNPDSETAEDSGDGNSRAPSPSGNGLRLDDSSRNGSSSAYAAGAGALHGAGLGYRGNQARSGAGAGTLADDDDVVDHASPAYDDEGYDDGDAAYPSHAGMTSVYGMQNPDWTFASVPHNGDATGQDEILDDNSSNQPAYDEDVKSRIAQDFDDDDGSFLPGSPPMLDDTGTPALVGPVGLGAGSDEDEVAEIRVEAD